MLNPEKRASEIANRITRSEFPAGTLADILLHAEGIEAAVFTAEVIARLDAEAYVKFRAWLRVALADLQKEEHP